MAADASKPGLEALLGRQSADGFLRDRYGKAFHHSPGSGERVESLFSPAALLELLANRALEPEKVRLATEGRAVPPREYVRESKARRGQRRAYVDADAVDRLTAEGATLAVVAVDGDDRAVRGLVRSLEDELGDPISVNAYLSRSATKGFDTHWDDHDVFVIQVAGAKAWRVFGMSTSSSTDDRGGAAGPAGEPIWSGEIGPGDVLYIPRGFWHDASTTQRPSLHLTLGVFRPTGVDLVHWLASTLGDDAPELRRDIPRFSSPAERAEFVAVLRERLLGRLDAPDELIERFLAHRAENARVEPACWSALLDPLAAPVPE
jgi:ribosomal protein L16 Arg81 hydroxylase